jgi:photosystem II stability/assembly factor-like uncharacterized protein
MSPRSRTCRYRHTYIQLSTLSIFFLLVVNMTGRSPLYAQSPIWKQIDVLYGASVRSIAVAANGDVFAATDGGLYRSIDNCRSWTHINLVGNDRNSVNWVAIHPSGTMLASEGSALFLSHDGGATWRGSSGGYNVQPQYIDSTGRIYGFLYRNLSGLSDRKGLVFSMDAGETWTSFALDTVRVTSLQVTRRGTWFAFDGYVGERIFRSLDQGRTWRIIGGDSLGLQTICETNDGTLFAHSWQNQSTYRSNDGGSSWSLMAFNVNNIQLVFVDREDRLIIGTYWGIFISLDKGATWRQTSTLKFRSWSRCMTQDAAGAFYAGSLESGMYRSADGSTWEPSQAGMTASRPRLLCDSHSGALFATTTDTLFVSRDDGMTWQPINVESAQGSIQGVVDSHGHIFLAGWYGVLRSADDGGTWELLQVTNASEPRMLGCTPEDVLFVSTYNGEVYRSMDEGQHWARVWTEGNDPWLTNSMIVMPDGSVVIERNRKLYRTKDNGNTWQETGTIPWDNNWPITAAHNGSLLAVGPKGLLMSDNGGAAWKDVRIGDGVSYVNGISTDASGSIYVVSAQSVFQSVDDGKSWAEISDGIRAEFVTAIKPTSKGYLFAETQYFGLYRTINPVKPRSKPDKPPAWNPEEYTLGQNYPNPFNPTTTIAFTIPSGSFVTLRIFNGLGQQVAELMSQELPAGMHLCQWNASGMPSGVYYYRLQAGSFSETKRLLLIR